MGAGWQRSAPISDRRRTDAPRQQLAGAGLESFTSLFEQANDIVILNDRDGRIVAANRVAREFGGYTAEDVQQGVHLRDVLPQPDCEAAMLLTQRALDGESIPEVYEREAVLHNGSRRLLELRSNVLRRPGQPPLLQTIGRDITEKREAEAFQASLLQVSQALLTAQSLDELGRVICEQASRVLSVDGAYLWLRQGEDLVGCAAAGRMAKTFIGLRRSVANSLIGQIYRSPDVLIVNDFPHSLYNPQVPHLGVQAMLAVPLRRTHPPVGVLVFTDNANPRGFTAALRARALIFGAQTTVAIESALAREREEEEGRISAALLHVTRAIRELRDADDVLREIGRSTRTELQCDWTLVTLRDPASGTMRVAATEGVAPEIADELRLIEFQPADSEELRGLLEHRSVEVHAPPAAAAPLYQRWEIGSFLAAPMISGNRLSGAIVVGLRVRRAAFSARERRIAEGIAAQAAAAVDNARLVEDLRRANDLKSEFLGTMSHELRTPLNAILGYAQLLRDGIMGPISAEQAQALDRVVANGYGLLDLINTTLDVNRLEAGRVIVHPAVFPLEQLLEELRNEFGLRVPANVTLTWPEHVDLPPLRTDHGKLKAVVRNLVDNALKFTPGGCVTVGVHASDERERVWLSVQDTGIGIPANAIPLIFEMFRQVDGTQSVARTGVGLGLYVVRRYVELLGGKITVTSQLGKGSTFTVDIPLDLGSR
ncbi:MAG TPA: ATP-binding protein [Candidatus Margulisiibacteriota bacterium]|nr:ATP-binding protein [Candidatus Margulisiibacteriota bacterium]